MSSSHEGILRVSARAKYEIYKGRVVRACAGLNANGRWQPIVNIQLGAGLTDRVEVLMDEAFRTAAEAKRRSLFRAKQLVDTNAAGDWSPPSSL